MSEQNVDLVRSVYRAVNEDDKAAFLALLHPEVELTTSGIFPDLSPTYRGHQGAADYWKAVGPGPGVCGIRSLSRSGNASPWETR